MNLGLSDSPQVVWSPTLTSEDAANRSQSCDRSLKVSTPTHLSSILELGGSVHVIVTYFNCHGPATLLTSVCVIYVCIPVGCVCLHLVIFASLTILYGALKAAHSMGYDVKFASL